MTYIKKLFCSLFVGTMLACLAVSVPVMAAPHAKGPGLVPAAAAAAPASMTTMDFSSLENLDAEDLWDQFAEAEAGKKLYEMKKKSIRDQIRLYEGPGACFYCVAADSDLSSKLLEWKNEEYQLRAQKEQYEWQKKLAEAYLKLTGEKMGKAEIQNAIYYGTVKPSGLDSDELYTKRYDLELKDAELELQKKELECQYQLGQLSDSSFLRQFAAAFLQKEQTRMELDRINAELEAVFGFCAHPGPPAPLLP